MNLERGNPFTRGLGCNIRVSTVRRHEKSEAPCEWVPPTESVSLEFATFWKGLGCELRVSTVRRHEKSEAPPKRGEGCSVEPAYKRARLHNRVSTVRRHEKSEPPCEWVPPTESVSLEFATFWKGLGCEVRVSTVRRHEKSEAPPKRGDTRNPSPHCKRVPRGRFDIAGSQKLPGKDLNLE